MKQSVIIALAIAILSFLWVLSGSFVGQEDVLQTEASKEASAEVVLPSVRYKSLSAENYTHHIQVTGRSKASRVARLSAELDGKIEKITYREGAVVQKGEVLASLDKRDRKARVSEAKFRLKQKELEYNAAKSLETKGFNSKIRLAQTKADLEQAQADLEQAQENYENTEILSPFDAVIFERQAEEGDFVSKGQELFHLVDLDPLEVVAFVTEHEVQAIRKGTTVNVEFLKGGIHEGIVTFVTPAANESTRTFEVKMAIPNKNNDLRQGLTAKVTIPVSTYSAYKISPSVLSLNDDGEIGVKLVSDENKAVFYPVEILADYPRFMWIGGLPENVKLITVGQDFVKDGQAVSPIESKDDGLL